jgi:hypothetical protein
MSSPIQTPLPVLTHPNVAPPHELAEKEQAEYDRVLAHFANPDYVLPGVETENGALMEQERMWLVRLPFLFLDPSHLSQSYECILRYIRATKHNVSESIKRLEGTLKWRRDFGLYTSSITPEHVEPEAVTGKQFIFGHDTHGRPALYMCLSKQNTEESPRQIHFVFWVMERAIELMGPGVEYVFRSSLSSLFFLLTASLTSRVYRTVAFLVDYADNAKGPSFSTSRQLLNILQSHYPERLGGAAIAHLPWFIVGFFKLINPFIDPVTRAKMVFDPVPDNDGLWRSVEARDQGQDDAKLFDLDQLVSDSWMGSAAFTYTHEAYWPALLSMCETRRTDMTRVWRELGGVIGIKEWDVKVGIRDGLTTPERVADVTGQAS